TVLNYRSGEARDHLSKWRMALPFLKKADRVVVPSRFLHDVFAEFGLSADIVPNLVDLTQLTYRPRKPLLPRLICTRGFEPYYDVDLVVRAFARVKGAFPAASLCLVGSGSLEQRIRATVRELQLDGVEFTGAVARDRIGQFYDRNHIFVNASWLDNMPVSLLEAFASGTPVVTTAPDGIRYIVEHERTGLLCAPKDWQGLAENVLRLLRNPDFALGLARNAYEESRRYRWAAVRDQWLEVYRSACGFREAERLAQPAEPSARPECVTP
ncbi:MAG: glycosyltransferase family 4 protein, partial [Candidatus Acidiferrales bacterium]